MSHYTAAMAQADAVLVCEGELRFWRERQATTTAMGFSSSLLWSENIAAAERALARASAGEFARARASSSRTRS